MKISLFTTASNVSRCYQDRKPAFKCTPIYESYLWTSGAGIRIKML